MKLNPKLIFPFIRKNAPTILSGMAVCGVALTGWLTHKAARKSDPEKSLKENWKNYIPCGIAGIGTIVCIIGANCMHLNIEAGLISAVAFYKATGEEFEDAVFDKFGDAGLKENVVDVKDDKNENPSSSKNMKIRIWEPYTSQWFEASQQEILWAELTANKLLAQTGSITINDILRFYSDPNIKFKRIGDRFGWSWDDDCFQESSQYYYAGGWIDMCPQFDDSQGNYRFVMDYGINPTDISKQ